MKPKMPNPPRAGLLAAVALVASFALAGCGLLDRAGGLLSVQSTAPTVEPPPEPSAEHRELRSGAADFGAQVLARVHNLGADAGAALIAQAARAADAVSGDVGKPARPWPLAVAGVGQSPPAVDAFEAVPSVEDDLDDYADAVAKDRADRREWEAEVVTQARAPARRSWSIGSPALGAYMLFGIGGVGALLVAAGRWAWKWRKTAMQIVPGVQGILDVARKGVTQTHDDMIATLQSTQDLDVQKTIKDAKARL